MSKAFLRSAKNLVNGYSQAQVLVRSATSNDKDGPSVDQLDELAERTFDNVEFFEIMDMLDKRLNDKGRNWRHVAKSLTCLDFLVRCGSENCVFWCKENLYIIKTLREFTHTDEFTEIDNGEIVRVKAKELTALLRDEERLKEERMMRLKGRKRGGRKNRRDDNEDDDDLQRALEESRITAEEEERRRKQLMMQGDDSSLQAALELSKEEEELRRLQQLQAQQQAALWQQQQQQQPMYYDIFGNPISAEEYLQYQQQQMLAQQQQEQYMAEQQYLAAQQQYLAQQQMLAQQQQQLLAQQQQQQFQMPLQTGSNNPFALNRPPSPQEIEEIEEPDFTPVQLPPSPSPAAVPQQEFKPVPKQRTGNQSISDKFSELNNLLASGTGIDTFGNTGETRVPAQHTKTGTFINSQGTGYKQITNDAPKHNPFLTSQYTGIPSSAIAPSYTGYGFGNQASSSSQQNNFSNRNGNSNNINNTNLIDL